MKEYKKKELQHEDADNPLEFKKKKILKKDGAIGHCEDIEG